MAYKLLAKLKSNEAGHSICYFLLNVRMIFKGKPRSIAVAEL